MESRKGRPYESTLKINIGVDSPPIINAHAVDQMRIRSLQSLSDNDYFLGLREGNNTILSQAITLIESALPEHQIVAQKIISMCFPFSGNSIRIGITGVPGAGKSTFIEILGKYLTSIGRKVAVLAIDPSSTRSKGSILGDKTRMEELASDTRAFIRPSPSSGALGGVARKTRETIILCEAAGFDIIIIETVGVGQSETSVHSMVDFFLLLMLTGAGDELQGIKRGIMEMADGILINKADGVNLPKVDQMLTELRNALHFFHLPESGRLPAVSSCSALTNEGIDKAWDMISDYITFVKYTGYFDSRRLHQSRLIMQQTIDQALHDHFYNHKEVRKRIRDIETELDKGKTNSFIAAQSLLTAYFNERKST